MKRYRVRVCEPERFQHLAALGQLAGCKSRWQLLLRGRLTSHPSAFTQEIGGLSDGHTYTLTFDDAAAQQFDYVGNTIDDWVVTLGGQAIATTILTSIATTFPAGKRSWSPSPTRADVGMDEISPIDPERRMAVATRSAPKLRGFASPRAKLGISMIIQDHTRSTGCMRVLTRKSSSSAL